MPGGRTIRNPHILYVHAATGIVSNGLVPGDPKRTEFAWVENAFCRLEKLLRCASEIAAGETALGSIVAIDMNKGEILWKSQMPRRRIMFATNLP